MYLCLDKWSCGHKCNRSIERKEEKQGCFLSCTLNGSHLKYFQTSSICAKPGMISGLRFLRRKAHFCSTTPGFSSHVPLTERNVFTSHQIVHNSTVLKEHGNSAWTDQSRGTLPRIHYPLCDINAFWLARQPEIPRGQTPLVCLEKMAAP